MHKEYEKLFTHLKPVEPPAGLFDRIILAIEQEQELRNTKKLAFSFLVLLVLSFSFVPFSWTFFLRQMAQSGVFEFISIAINDLGIFFTFWQDFSLAIIESLPIVGIIVFIINIILVLFTVRLFLYKKKLLMEHLIRGFN